MARLQKETAKREDELRNEAEASNLKFLKKIQESNKANQDFLKELNATSAKLI